MKKLFIIFSFLLFFVIVKAQQLPNCGFELWSSPDHPDFWSTNATSLPYPGLDYFAVKDTSVNTEGRASLRLTTDTFSSQGTQVTYASQVGLGTGTFVNGHGIYFSGIAYNSLVTTLRFKYRYLPARTIDSGLMQFNLVTQSGVSSFARGAFGWKIGSTAGHWDSAFFLFDSASYGSAGRPDTLKLVFYSSISGGGLDPQAFGTILWLDDIQVTTPTTSVSDVRKMSGEVNVYPNPAGGFMEITIGQREEGSEIQITDLEGKEVYQGISTCENIRIDIHSWPAGLYAVRVKSIDKITIYVGKLIVEH